jgi:hypothetical protein
MTGTDYTAFHRYWLKRKTHGITGDKGRNPPRSPKNNHFLEPVPKLIDCSLTRTVLGQALAVFQAFSLVKPRISRLLSQN